MSWATSTSLRRCVKVLPSSKPNRSSSVIGPCAERTWRTTADIDSAALPDIVPRLLARVMASAGDPRTTAQERGHLLDKLFEVPQVAESGQDDDIRHLDVLVHKHIAESDRLTHRIGYFGSQRPMAPKHFHCFAVVRRRTPALRRANVLSDINTRLDRRDESVLHAAQPHRVDATLFTSIRFPIQDTEIIGDCAQQP